MKYILIALSFFFISSFAYAETLRFATEATYPPFEYFDDNGELQGFDIDIARAICKELAVTCSITHQAFSSLIPSLQMGKFDALIAALGATPERAKEVAFSDSYYTPSASFVSFKNRHYNLADLKNKIVGVQGGSIFRDYLVHYYNNAMDIKFYASIQDAFLDLSVGRLDAVLADTPIANNYVQLDPSRFTIVEHPIEDKDYFGSGYAIAVKKSNTSLLQRINTALQTIKHNGVYDQLVKKYFGAKAL